jgi:hypothetical protein
MPAKMRVTLLALGLIGLIGCQSDRYELGKDSQGRAIRLDKKTGKVELADDLVSSAAPSEGSPLPSSPEPKPSAPAVDPAERIVLVEILGKRYDNSDLQDYVFFDLRYRAAELDKPARAIKGKMLFQDLFGEPRLAVGWTIDDSLAPGQAREERGTGFEYNQFMDDHQWARATASKDMKAVLHVNSIIYADGTRRDFQ